jgi:hypothetical protein
MIIAGEYSFNQGNTYIKSKYPVLLQEIKQVIANFAEIGHLFGLKTAGCSGKSATPWWRWTKVQFNSLY